MSVILAMVLLAVIIVGAIALAIGVPLFFGLMAWDVHESRKTAPVEEKEAKRRVSVERGVARAFVVGGGLFWSLASLAGLYSFTQTGTNAALIAAFLPLVACLATIVVGWYYERLTAALLLVASVAVVAWGVIYGFDGGAWLLVTFALIGPMMTASVLFSLARTDHDAYESASGVRLDLAPMVAARSSLRAAA